MLCDYMGWGSGREAQERGDVYICILTADPHCCIEETNTTFKGIIFQLKNKCTYMHVLIYTAYIYLYEYSYTYIN